VKTTIDIADALWAEATKLAAKRHVSLSSLVEQGLRQVLEEQGSKAPRFALRDASVGGLGLNRDLQGKAWSEIRDMVNEGLEQPTATSPAASR
jgi:hypothetical protein